jgi:hypothetical protein
VLAIDQFVELLPSLAASRAAEQHARVRSDAALRPLFGDAFEPLVDLPDYLRAHEILRTAFDIDAAFHRRSGPMDRAAQRLRRLTGERGR